MRKLSRSAAAVIVLACAGLTESSARAADGTWIATASGLWSNSANWAGGLIADGAQARADFSTVNLPAGTLAVGLDSPRTLGLLDFNDLTAVNGQHPVIDITNNGVPSNVLTLDNGAAKPSIVVRNNLQWTPTAGTGATGPRSATISTRLAGSNGFIKSAAGTNAGLGTLILSGDNSGLTGGITIEQGRIHVTNNNALGSNVITVQASGTPASTNFQQLSIGAGVTVSNDVVLNANSGISSAPHGVIHMNEASGIATYAGNVTVNNQAQGGGTFSGGTGTGLLNVTGTVNTASGGNIFMHIRGGNVRMSGTAGNAVNWANSGNLSLGANNPFNTQATLTINQSNAATFNLNGFNQQLVRLAAVSGTAASTYLTNNNYSQSSTLTIDNFIDPGSGSGQNGFSANVWGNLGLAVTDSTGLGGGLLLSSNNSANIGVTTINTQAGALSPVRLQVTSISPGGVLRSLTTSAGSTAATVVDATGLVVGQAVVGNGIAPGTTVSAITGTSVTLSAAASTTETRDATTGIRSALGIAPKAASNLVINGGTLEYTGTAASTSDRDFTVTGTATINVVNAVNLTLGGATSSGSIVKTGSGTLILNGNSDYAGATSVTGGGLIVNGMHAGGSAYTVTGNFGGRGTITAPVTLNGPATSTLTVGPYGNSPAGIGTLTTGGLDVQGGYTLNFDLGSTVEVGGTANDLVVVNGVLNFAGANTVNISPVGASLATGEYGLIRYGSLSGGTAGLTLTGVPVGGRQGFALGTGLIGGDSYLKLIVTGNPFDLIWNGGNGNNDWDVNLTQNWQQTAPLDQKFFTGDNVTFNDSSANRTVNLAGALTPGSLAVNTASTYTFEGTGTLEGGGTLAKSGSGTLVLAVDSTMSGAVTISGGTVQLGNGGTTGSLGGGDITNDGSLVVNRSSAATLILNNNIGGAGSFTQAGPGNVAVRGNNSYAGQTIINGGTLFVDTATSLGSGSSGTIVNSGGRLGVFTGNFNLSAETLSLDGTGPDGLGSVQVGGARTVTFGTTTLAAQTTIRVDAGARMIIAGNLSSGGASLDIGGGTSTTLGGILQVNGNVNLSGGTITTNDVGGSGTFALNVPTATTTVFDTPVAGTGQVRYNGLGTVDLTVGNKTYTGDTFVDEGLVRVSNAGTLGLGVVRIAGGATPQVQATLGLTGGVTISNAIQIAGRQGTAIDTPSILNMWGTNTVNANITSITGGTNYNVQSDAGTLIINGTYTQANASTPTGRDFKLQGAGNGVITGAVIDSTSANTFLRVIKRGAGTWSLTGDSTYNGATLVAEGTLQIGNGGTTGSISSVSAVTVEATGTFAFNRTDAHTITNTISGAGGVLQAGSGTTVLSGANTYTGASTVNAGTLELAPSAQAGLLATGDSYAHVRSGRLVLDYSGGTSLAGVVFPLLASSFSGQFATGEFRSASATASRGLGWMDDTANSKFIVAAALYGDANLDRIVNFDDLLLLAANYNSSSRPWSQGDFTYDGAVNFDDLLKLAANYNQSLPSSSLGEWSLARASVPEPASLSVAVLLGALILRRRRHSSTSPTSAYPVGANC